MTLKLENTVSKKDVFEQVRKELEQSGFKIVDQDQSRPWGGFYVIDEVQSQKFIQTFLHNVPEAHQNGPGKISPKILIVESGKRLSWQYHHRRAEVWKVIGGQAGVVISDTDEQTSLLEKKEGDIIVLKQGERHRLIGTDGWGVIAEIWQHTDPEVPSNEDDIVRVSDDFGR